MQSFNKESNNLFGYVIKVALSAPPGSLYAMEPWQAIDQMLTPDEFKQALKKAIQMWMHVLYIYQISTNGQGS